MTKAQKTPRTAIKLHCSSQTEPNENIPVFMAVPSQANGHGQSQQDMHTQPEKRGTQPEKRYKCSRCTHARYCNRECQRTHWGVHRLVCCNSLNSHAASAECGGT
jgi:sulfatase maturation enzyme AslB (radical SAM superfamily)